MVDLCHMIDIRSPGCRRTAVIFALRVGRTSDLTGLPKTLNGRGGRGFHGALTTAPPAPARYAAWRVCSSSWGRVPRADTSRTCDDKLREACRTAAAIEQSRHSVQWTWLPFAQYCAHNFMYTTWHCWAFTPLKRIRLRDKLAFLLYYHCKQSNSIFPLRLNKTRQGALTASKTRFSLAPYCFQADLGVQVRRVCRTGVSHHSHGKGRTGGRPYPLSYCRMDKKAERTLGSRGPVTCINAGSTDSGPPICPALGHIRKFVPGTSVGCDVPVREWNRGCVTPYLHRAPTCCRWVDRSIEMYGHGPD
jgi:hypothetical protein